MRLYTTDSSKHVVSFFIFSFFFLSVLHITLIVNNLIVNRLRRRSSRVGRLISMRVYAGRAFNDTHSRYVPGQALDDKSIRYSTFRPRDEAAAGRVDISNCTTRIIRTSYKKKKKKIRVIEKITL